MCGLKDRENRQSKGEYENPSGGLPSTLENMNDISTSFSSHPLTLLKLVRLVEGQVRGIEQAWEVPLCVDFGTLGFDRYKVGLTGGGFEGLGRVS